jgi:hypothetical protein
MLEESAVPGAKTIVGLPAMKPVIDFGMNLRVDIAKIKSHFEVFLGFLSIILLFCGRIAPIFPIFFW